MRHSLVISIMLAMCLYASAEYRIWSDKTGYAVEAEFVCESGGQMVFRDREGKEYKIDPESLSEEDQHYLQSLMPPTLDINVNKLQETRQRGERREGIVQCIARIKKTSTRPYTGRLTAHMLVIGRDRRTDAYMILSKAKGEFELSRANKEQYVFKSNRVHIGFSMHTKSSREYAGYLVVVKDSRGEVVAVKTNRKSFEKIAKKLLAQSPNYYFKN